MRFLLFALAILSIASCKKTEGESNVENETVAKSGENEVVQPTQKSEVDLSMGDEDIGVADSFFDSAVKGLNGKLTADTKIVGADLATQLQARGAKFLLYPISRSSQPATAGQPRMVAYLEGVNGPEYYGISTEDRKSELEAYIWDNEKGRGVFGLLKDSYDGNSIQAVGVTHTCVMCHAAAMPIIEVAPRAVISPNPYLGVAFTANGAEEWASSLAKSVDDTARMVRVRKYASSICEGLFSSDALKKDLTGLSVEDCYGDILKASLAKIDAQVNSKSFIKKYKLTDDRYNAMRSTFPTFKSHRLTDNHRSTNDFTPTSETDTPTVLADEGSGNALSGGEIQAIFKSPSFALGFTPSDVSQLNELVSAGNLTAEKVESLVTQLKEAKLLKSNVGSSVTSLRQMVFQKLDKSEYAQKIQSRSTAAVPGLTTNAKNIKDLAGPGPDYEVCGQKIHLTEVEPKGLVAFDAQCGICHFALGPKIMVRKNGGISEKMALRMQDFAKTFRFSSDKQKLVEAATKFNLNKELRNYFTTISGPGGAYSMPPDSHRNLFGSSEKEGAKNLEAFSKLRVLPPFDSPSVICSP